MPNRLGTAPSEEKQFKDTWLLIRNNEDQAEMAQHYANVEIKVLKTESYLQWKYLSRVKGKSIHSQMKEN